MKDFAASQGLDGNRFFSAVVPHALNLGRIAERQQGLDVQPDVRLAVARCLQVAKMRVLSGLPFVPAPPHCIKLVQMAGRIMASFAAAPEAASAASFLMMPICSFLAAVSDSVPQRVRQLASARRSLLASVQLLLEGSSPFLTAATVTARGPVVVVEAASSIYCALHIAAQIAGAIPANDEIRLAAQLMQKCQELLADPAIADQLKERLRYPVSAPFPIAQQFVEMATRAGTLVIHLVFSQSHTEISADCQQQVLALSAAVMQPSLLHGLGFELAESPQQPAATTYYGAALLADLAKLSTAALCRDPNSVCQPAGWAASLTLGAVTALAFAVWDSSRGCRPPDVDIGMPACMQYAAVAAEFMQVLAQQLSKTSRANAEAARSALTTQGAAQSLVRLLLWLSEPTTAIATASGLLAEVLPALRLMAADEDMRQVLAEAGGPHAWSPVAKALRRRLPRGMATRFLPELDRVSAAVAGGATYAPCDDDASKADAIAVAEAAMAELLQVMSGIPGNSLALLGVLYICAKTSRLD